MRTSGGWAPDQAAAQVARLPARREAPAQARRWLRRRLEGHPRLNDALLATSELINNALEFSSLPPSVGLGLALERTDHSIRITVRQRGTGSIPPSPAFPPPTQARGRGLAIVASVADRWGVHEGRGDLELWFELDAAPGPHRD